MENVVIKGTDRSPQVEFDYSSNRFFIGGYSYPENVKDFYGPFIDPMIAYLGDLQGTSVEFSFAFNYFHSSSAQILYTLFDMLEICAENGNTVRVTWHYETDDESMKEAGEDFSEDAEHVEFSVKQMDPE